MYRTLLLLLCGIMLAMLATACPRDKGGENAGDKTGTDVDITVNNEDTSSTDSKTTADTDTSATDAEKPADGTTPDAAADAATDTSTPDASTQPPADPSAKVATKVEIDTTKGKIVLEVHPEWAPLGAARFIELVNAGFYDGAPFFRVVDGFMMQTGLAADAAKNAEWSEKRIADDPMVTGISNTEGMVSFAMAGPNTRTTQFFINFGDNSMLDSQGFSPFAKVAEGMDVVNKIFKTGENDPRANIQGLLHQPGGLDQVKAIYPEMDFIKKATVLK